MDSDVEEASYIPGDTTVKVFSEQHFGAVASPYVAAYVFRTVQFGQRFRYETRRGRYVPNRQFRS